MDLSLFDVTSEFDSAFCFWLAHLLAIPLLAAPASSFGIDHAVTCATAALIFFTHG
jgi:hypothetical protein